MSLQGKAALVTGGGIRRAFFKRLSLGPSAVGFRAVICEALPLDGL